MEEKETRSFDIYNKIKIGKKTLNDVVLDLEHMPPGNYWACDKYLTDKRTLARALHERDLETLRAISNYFYKMSGIYQKICNYFATIYRYDWYISPEVFDEDTKSDWILKDFSKLLNYLDSSYIKKTCADIALNVIKDGAYYGYVIETGDEITLQELPIKYCRSLYSVKGLPAIEFNMAFFDEKFPNPAYRQKILKMFPDEFSVGYKLYKEGKLVDETVPQNRCLCGIRTTGWYLLEPSMTVKFSFSNGDIPMFVNTIPAILDLDVAEALDRKRQAQQLIKILVQKLPLDKNFDLVFDVDEARDIHENAVMMLRGSEGLDVLTTFADVQDIDLSSASDASDDSVENAVSAVYRSAGMAENLFDSDGNISTEKSILVDEAAARQLLLQFQIFFDRIVQRKNAKPKKYKFRFYMLETTQNNYKDISDKYKAQVQLGYSKILPQIALGHSQSSILNTAYFENHIMNLSTIMIPPLQSSVMNAETLQLLGKKTQEVNNAVQGNTEDSKTGRPEKPESEKSDKTLANIESQK